MCRWLAYTGNSIAIDEILFEPEHSLIDQSMSSRMTREPTNGDGFGVGWYGRDGQTGVYRGVQPAWNDANLRDVTRHIESTLFLAHVRRSTGTAVQQTNCHPFRHGRWLFVHNGSIRGYEAIRRALTLAVHPELFRNLHGSTDSELMFHLALTFGLDDDPVGALEQMAGYIERLGREAGIEDPLQMTLGVADGETLYAVRYSSVGESRTLFHSTNIAALRVLYPDHPRLGLFTDDAMLISSEPTTDIEGVFEAVPESTVLIAAGGKTEELPFQPHYRS